MGTLNELLKKAKSRKRLLQKKLFYLCIFYIVAEIPNYPGRKAAGWEGKADIRMVGYPEGAGILS